MHYFSSFTSAVYSAEAAGGSWQCSRRDQLCTWKGPNRSNHGSGSVVRWLVKRRNCSRLCPVSGTTTLLLCLAVVQCFDAVVWVTGSGLRKTRIFLKKAQPSGCFWVLLGFGLCWLFRIFCIIRSSWEAC